MIRADGQEENTGRRTSPTKLSHRLHLTCLSLRSCYETRTERNTRFIWDVNAAKHPQKVAPASRRLSQGRPRPRTGSAREPEKFYPNSGTAAPGLLIEPSSQPFELPIPHADFGQRFLPRAHHAQPSVRTIRDHLVHPRHAKQIIAGRDNVPRRLFGVRRRF